MLPNMRGRAKANNIANFGKSGNIYVLVLHSFDTSNKVAKMV